MTVSVPYDSALENYDLGPSHPLKPERFSLAVALMRAYGILAEDGYRTDDSGESAPGTGHSPGEVAIRVAPDVLRRTDIELVHERAYIDTVLEASENPGGFRSRMGLGPGDTPAFGGMHDASMLICGASARAMRMVLEGSATRSLAPAGGLHHAHADRAAGFCTYNDPAVAIAIARKAHPDLKVMYIDVDAHHGDGVEEAFWHDPNVLTLSVHESGKYLFPGTGRATDTGGQDAPGSAINVPLPPYTDGPGYQLVLDRVIEPAAARFSPDVIVAQCGADSHRDDPLTHLGLSLVGYGALVSRLIEIADSVCEGRIVATGGGGYGTYSVVPRAWTILLAHLIGVELPEELPESWRSESFAASGTPAPHGLTEEKEWESPFAPDETGQEVSIVIDQVIDASPLLG